MRSSGLQEMAAFRAVADAGSFVAGARAIGITPSAMSQTIKRLEARLGVQLLHRTTRSVSTTEPGARLLLRLRRAFEEIEGATQELADARGSPKGAVRIVVPRALYADLIEPLLRRFADAYPDVTLDIRLDDGSPDIASGGYDLGFRLGNRIDPQAVAFPLGPPLRKIAVASPAYLADYGWPRHPSDLTRHRCINTRDDGRADPYPWVFCKGSESLTVAVEGPLVLNDREAAVRAAASGLGVAMWCEYRARPWIATGQLVPLLEDWASSFPAFYAFYYRNRHQSPATRALVGFLRKEGSLPA